MQFKLRPYQQDAVNAVHESLRSIKRPVIVLPTGAGKTAVFTRIAIDRGGQCLIIVHKDDLLNQAKQSILAAKPNARIGIIKSSLHQPAKPFVIASVQTLSQPDRLRRINANFNTIVIDECHHAVASTYKRVLEKFQNAPCVLGVTATLERADGIGLSQVFDRIVYGDQPGHASIDTLVNAGYLVRPIGRDVRLNADVSKHLAERDEDSDFESIWSVMEAANWKQHAVKAWTDQAKGRRGVMFLHRIEQANEAAEYFKGEGIPAAAIHGGIPDNDQRQIRKDFEAGKIQLLVTVDLMIEGTDIPCIAAVVIARFTKSRRILQQCVGRGLRPHPGKKDCLVLDLTGSLAEIDLSEMPTLIGKDMDVPVRTREGGSLGPSGGDDFIPPWIDGKLVYRHVGIIRPKWQSEPVSRQTRRQLEDLGITQIDQMTESEGMRIILQSME